MKTIFWHDYETFGADPQKDRPSQFAGIRTDYQLNIIGDPVTIYCRPTDDYLPSVEACLITGITPQHARSEGMSESEFAECIYREFSHPETCVAGYNSIRFDDEVTRNLFYRNFIDPYEREWKAGNSRWDIIDVARLCYALRPEGINWPKDDAGNTSFRLEKLTQANDISHAAAHDAMSDVYATIALARLIRAHHPKLFDYAFAMRTKQSVAKFLEQQLGKPFLHFSSKYPVTNGCMSLVYPLAKHPTNKNGLVVFDLRQSPKYLLDKSVEQLKALLFTAQADIPEGEERPALKVLHINKCPMLAPAAMMKTIANEQLVDWGLSRASLLENLKLVQEKMDELSSVSEVFVLYELETNHVNDPDLMIYSGGFFSPSDRAQMEKIRRASANELNNFVFDFQDPRLEEMLFRYKARNFPEILEDEEQEKWISLCKERLLCADSPYLSFERFAQSLKRVASSQRVPNQQSLLDELQLYAESIYPY